MILVFFNFFFVYCILECIVFISIIFQMKKICFILQTKLMSGFLKKKKKKIDFSIISHGLDICDTFIF